VKAITTGAAWAHAIAFLGKDVENLPQTSPRISTARRLVGEEILIHASGKAPTVEQWESAAAHVLVAAEKGRPGARNALALLDRILPAGAYDRLPTVPRGALVARARLVAVADDAGALGSPWGYSGDVGLILADVRPLARPIPCPGALYWFDVPQGALDGALAWDRARRAWAPVARAA
jgi:hypothetical protein